MREETREREPHHQPERMDHAEGAGWEPSQAHQWDVLRTLDQQPAGLLSPGGTRWEISGQEPADPCLFTQRPDGSQRAADLLTRKQFTTLWANPERQIKGWRRTDAPADVHHKARRSLAKAERKRKKRAEDPEFREKEKKRLSAWHRKKIAEDPVYRENKNRKSAEWYREKKLENPAFRKAANSKAAERLRKKRAEDPVYREAVNSKAIERYRKKRAEDPSFREAENIRSAEWVRRKRAENPSFRGAENSKAAERRRKKRAEDPSFREAEKFRSSEWRRKKIAEDPYFHEVERIRAAEWRRKKKRAEDPVSRGAGRNSPQSDHPVAASPKALPTSETSAFKRYIPDLNLPAQSPSEEE